MSFFNKTNDVLIVNTFKQIKVFISYNAIVMRCERAFSYAGPVVWNNLPLYIRAEPDIARFKNILKTYFLTRI